MIEKTLSELEERLHKTTSLNNETKAELAGLLSNLRKEVGDLSKTHTEQAQSITGFTAVSAHEAIREDRNPALRTASVQGLAASVAGFEKSHPKLVEVVNRICVTLANMGV